MDDSSKQEVSKVPLLGDIPSLGNFFRYTSNEKNKRNLMVFIRPTIIRDDEVYHSLSRDKYTGFKEMQQNRSSKQNGSLIDVDAIESLDDHAFDSSVATPAKSNSKIRSITAVQNDSLYVEKKHSGTVLPYSRKS